MCRSSSMSVCTAEYIVNRSKKVDDGQPKIKINKKKSLYLSVGVFSTAVLIGDTANKETNIINQQKLVKNPNWQEADQLTIYKACRS